MKIGTQIKVKIEGEKECFPPDGILIAHIKEIFTDSTEEEYLIEWQCKPGLHGGTVIKQSDILEVLN